LKELVNRLLKVGDSGISNSGNKSRLSYITINIKAKLSHSIITTQILLDSIFEDSCTVLTIKAAADYSKYQ
jgi:hypothetical protein